MRIGYNAAGAVSLIDNPPSDQLVGLVGDIHCGVLRFMGGTISQTERPAPEQLASAAAFAKACNVPVLWVVNIFSVTRDCIDGLKAFRDAGVEVIGVEAGNETYGHKDYMHKPTDYLRRAGVFAAAIHAFCDRNSMPLIPIGVVIAPSASMKEYDQKPEVTARLVAWNNVVLKCEWADAFVLHCYTNSASATIYSQLWLPTFLNNISRTTSKQVWITEHGLTDGHGTPAQGEHYVNTLNAVKAFPQVTICTAHNLLSAEDAAYNFIEKKAKGKYVLTQLGTTAAQQ